jgi:hypothetical protein
MKGLLRALGTLIFFSVLLLAGAMLYSTLKGYTTWYFRVNGRVTVDGRKTTGYMHANTQRTILLLTRTDDARPETYLVPLRGHQAVLDCGAWHPARFLPFPVGDLSPPCSFFTDPAAVRDPLATGTLQRMPRSVEFATVSGRKVKAEW